MFAAMKSGSMASYTPPAPQPVAQPTQSTYTSSSSDNNRDDSRKAQLKVLGIPEGTDVETLKDFFSDVAKAVGAKILPLQEGRTTALGFVDFEKEQDVQNCVNSKNNAMFNGSSLRLFPASGGNNSRPGGNSSGGDRPQVKVLGIPDGSDEGQLQSLFSEAGNVTRMNILPCREGRNTTLGFVHYNSQAEVDKAVSLYNDYEFNGSKLRVMSANTPSNGISGSSAPLSNNFMNGSSSQSRSSSSGMKPQAKVYNIPDGTTEDEITALFGNVGICTGCKILPCREGKDVTLGFVHFQSEEEVDKAAQMYHDYDFKGSRLRVEGSGGSFPSRQSDSSQSRPMGRGAQLLANVNAMNGGGGGDFPQRRERGPQAKVFGIPEGTSQDELKDFFSPAGNVTNTKVLPLREGKDTHLGFIEFSNDSEVQAAVDQFDGQDFKGSNLKVMVGQTSGGSGGGSSFQNSSWNSSSIAPTSRIPRFGDRSNGGGGMDGGIQLDANFDMNGGMMGDDMMMNRPPPVNYIPPPPPETEDEIFQLGINEGINFEKYFNIPVEITGTNAPKPVNNFAEAQLNHICLKNLIRAKYSKPTPVQKYALPTVLSRRDLMACAQTGSGKTASFLLPVITNLLNDGVTNQMSLEGAVFPLALVIVPTRELAVQIFRESIKFAYDSPVRTQVIYGGVSVNHQTDALRRGCHILVATPGRLEDFIQRGKINFKNLKYLILDEADRMLDMGFGQALQNIINTSEMPPKGLRSTLMFSATFPKEIQQMAANLMNDYLFLTVGRVGGACADIQQTIMQVAGSEKRSTLEKLLQDSGSDRTLVFVERKKDADFLASFLSQRNYPTTSLNGDRSQQEREMALEDFRRGKAPVLVATAVAARGLDVKDVKHVINYDLPSDPTEYVHRIGRTGRIGNKGKATSFFDVNRDGNLARPLVKYLSEAEQEVPDWFEDFALRAVGTGYGTDQSQFRDQRSKFSRNGGGGGMGGVPTQGKVVSLANTADDDDEEW
ncbi:uncharacterized protein [Clytia hemisphaerica]|uniref:RNA helicase n=1 Tax=Clytia hemisphaerica TaxID=252671 RepID=A0A7M5UPS2_9CNID